jgi:agmatinase
MADTTYPSFLGLDIPPASYEEANIHIIPVEMEKSVSYGAGTAAGPRAILEASLQLEAFDGSTVPGQAGMYTHKPVTCQADKVEKDIEAIASEVTGVLEKKGLPVILGGEHTVTLGSLKAFASSGKKVGVVQFDAHADLRDSYGGNHLSHACVMRRVHEMNLPFMQIGIRSLEQIYITFDVDCFDASIMPATGTPEPGGLTWYQVMDLLHKISDKRSVCGFDVVELAPISGMHAPDFTAAKLVYKLIGLAVS